jgi:SAM-dependent methyltransferase
MVRNRRLGKPGESNAKCPEADLKVPWHPASAAVIDLYERHATAWDRDRGKNLFERAWLDRLREALPVGGEILDLGCGSAEPIARYFVETGFRVCGVDTSPTMIALCKSRFPAHTWIVGDMRDVRLGHRFDAVLAWDSFFHLTQEDQRRTFETFELHAKPMAALMFTSGPHGGEAIGSYQGEELYHASLEPSEYRVLIAQRGFRVADYAGDDETCGGHTVWLARRGSD